MLVCIKWSTAKQQTSESATTLPDVELKMASATAMVVRHISDEVAEVTRDLDALCGLHAGYKPTGNPDLNERNIGNIEVGVIVRVDTPTVEVVVSAFGPRRFVQVLAVAAAIASHHSTLYPVTAKR